jgi:hypothetical protein
MQNSETKKVEKPAEKTSKSNFDQPTLLLLLLLFLPLPLLLFLPLLLLLLFLMLLLLHFPDYESANYKNVFVKVTAVLK